MRRRGSVYFVVLATVTIVALLGTAGVLAQTRQRARADAALESAQAAALARSAIELGLARIMKDGDWRDTPGGGTWYKDTAPTGDPRDGVFTLTVTGPDGAALGEEDNDPFELVGTGRVGSATRTAILPFEAETGYIPMDCLGVSVLSNNDLRIKFNAGLHGNGIVASNNKVQASSAFVFADAEAANTVEGATYYGNTTSNVPKRIMPTRDQMLSAYMALKPVVISRDALPTNGSEFFLRRIVLSPGSNPFGTRETHPDGIYVIDMGDKDLIIEDVRIHGTLILIQPDNSSIVRGSVSISPAVEGYPSIIVTEKDLNFAVTRAPLDEAKLGVNFNPVGSMVEGGEDTDMADSYPSMIEGIVYSDKKLIFQTGTQLDLHGQLFSEGDHIEFEIGALVKLFPWTEAYDAPPPAFRAGTRSGSVVQGSWSRDFE